MLPTPQATAFSHWQSGSGASYEGGAAISDFTIAYTAQFIASYTLTDADVTLNEGTITACHNTSGGTHVIIPDTLQNQEVTGIATAVFKDMGVYQLRLPSPKAYNFLQWQSGSGQVYPAGSEVSDVLSSYSAEYKANLPYYTLQDKDVEMSADGSIISVYYDFSSKNIIIPDTLRAVAVKDISTGDLERRGIKALQLPGTLEHIHEYAFADNAIEHLTMPEKYFEMGRAVFNGNAIKTINGKPSDGLIFARNADGTTDSTTIVSYGGASPVIDFLPPKVKYISSEAFNSCDIAEVALHGDLSFLGEWAFAGNSITSLTLPGTKEWIDHEGTAYQGGDNITDLSNAYALNAHYTLTDADVSVQEGHITNFTPQCEATIISIPDTLHEQSVVGVRSGVFDNKGIVQLNLPQHRHFSDFKGWLSLDNENVRENEGQYALRHFSSSDISQDYYNKTYIAKLPAYTLTSMDVVVKDSCISESKFSFLVNERYVLDEIVYDTLSLPGKLIIPDTLHNQAIKGLGRSSLYRKGISSVSLPSTLEYIGEGALKYNAFSDITIPANVLTIDASAFSGGDGSFKSWLRTVHFEEGSQLENIGDYAFSKCSALQTIALPSGIKNIGVRAFAQCALNDVFIPKSIEIVGKEAFYYNFNGGLQGVVFEDSSQLRKIDEGAFAKNFALATNKFRLPTSALDDFLYWLAAGVGVGSGQTKYAEGASTHILTAKYTAQYRYTLSDNDVKVIDNYISEYSYSDGRPSYIVIPDTLDGQVIKGIKERVPMGLFYANRLAELELPAQLEYIPVNCFKYNALTNVELPEKLFFLGEAAFYGNRLSSLTLPNLTTSGFAGWIIHDHDSNKDSLITKTNGKYVAIDLWSSYTAAYAVKFTDHSGRLLKIDTVKHYAAASPPVAPERVGYTFMGWDKDYTNISQGLTLSAMYERNTSVAIDDKDAKGISIYPNPVSGGRLCLKTDEPISSIVIYDPAGKVVYTSSKSAYSIDVSHLRSGVYVIKINRTFKNLLIL